MIHERIHESAHGRAFAAYTALRNGAELAALALGGILVDAAGGRGTLVLSGAATLAVAALGLALLGRGATHASTPTAALPAASPLGRPA